MKKNKIILFLVLLLFFFFIFFGIITSSKDMDRSFDMAKKYEDLWKKIFENENKGLTKSSLDIAKEIYKKSKEEKNANQLIKSLIHIIKYRNILEEDAFENIIKETENDLNNYSYPLKNLLCTVLAELYWNYYQQNRYKFNDRTQTDTTTDEEIISWDYSKIVKKVGELYLMSLNDTDRIKNENINNYKDIILKYDPENLRPTLYDFLAHRALDFFTNEQAYLTTPVYKFELNDEKYFKLNNEFINIKINTINTDSFKYKAMLLFIDLIKFHLDDNNINALIDVDLKRIKFVLNNSVLQNKDQLYYECLEKIIEKYKDYKECSIINYEIANYYYSLGLKYQPEIKEEYKWMKKKALDTCLEAIKKYPDSYGLKYCNYLINEIQKKSIVLTTESVNITDKPFLANIEYNNVDKIYFSIIKLSDNDRKKIKQNYYNDEEYEKFINYLKSFKPVLQWETYLPLDGDYNVHSAEIKIPALSNGYYLIIASCNKDIAGKNNAIFYNDIWISNISYIKRSINKDGTYDVYVFNRDTGKPLEKINAQIYIEKYDYNQRYYKYIKNENYLTDKNGYFNIKPDNRTFSIEFTGNNDRLFLTESSYQNKPYDYKYPTIKTFFFTDRSIYRPGQTVYFKGIIIDSKSKDNRIVPNYNAMIGFYDVNNELINQINITTNEYGTFNGTFIAPVGKLNGLMTIKNNDNSGHIQVSVEEYKRPKFEVNIENLKGSYKVNETIKLKLNAKSYAGANIDNASVNYRVIRTVQFPYWLWWWGYYTQDQNAQIASGTGITDANGEYEINFIALPDLSISKDRLPVFTYQITADVVDINGETHSAATYVKIGYVGMEININIPDNIDKEAENKYMITSTNLSNEYEPSTGIIEIYKLKNPEHFYKERYWKKPDRFVMTENEFKKDFPFDQYNDENNYFKWEKDFKVLKTSYNTEKDKSLDLKDIKNWTQGKYILELKTKDKDGVDINYIKYFTVYSLSEKKVPYPSIAWSSSRYITAQPGDTVKVDCGSSDNDIFALYEIENEGKITENRIVNFNNGKKIFDIEVTENNRGNFTASITFIKHNRFFNYNFNIYVPWSNKELNIEFLTFRSKLLPGQNEEWKLKIAGNNKDRVMAEMVATLYDKSLDAFKPHNWYFNIFPYYYKSKYWQYQQNFAKNNFVTIQKNWNNVNYYPYYYYDRLNWFDLSYYYYSYYKDDRAESPKSMKKTERSKNKEYFAEEMPVSESKSDDKSGLIDGEKLKNNLIPDQKQVDTNQKDTSSEINKEQLQIRKDFSETAFFYPDIKTNENGEILISFKIPESLTKWKMLGFAHTKNLDYGFIENELVTQKDLMVVPNPPRFFRESDMIFFASKINNLSEKDLNGTITLELFDAITMKPINVELKNKNYKKTFSAKKGQSSVVNWELSIPEGIQAITYRVIAKAGDYSDGEEAIIPVMTNRMLVTESIPLPVRGKTIKHFVMQKLVDAKKSNTLKHEKLTLEFVTNPVWYAIQSLPYLIEYPYECSEQVFSRYYANSIASHIVNSNPKIKEVFEKWKNTDALLSNLQKNQELKQLLLEETPWVYEAKNEEQRKKMVGILFDMNNIANGLNSAIKKLKDMQTPNGGFPWFSGLPDDRYITQHILTGLAHLQKIGIQSAMNNNQINNIIDKGITYLDNRIKEDYEYLIKNKVNLNDDNTSYIQIQYLYMRSFYINRPIPEKSKKAFDYFKNQTVKFWLFKNKYMQGMIAIILNRYNDKKIANDIIISLKENSINNEELGMYWKDLSGGYYWYEAPIETQSLLIEAFNEVANDKLSVDDMKIWLLKQKQVQDWKTTKATTDACYALILTGSDWLANDNLPEITLGDIKIDPATDKNIKIEPGTGYFKTSWNKEKIMENMGNVTVVNKNDNVAWGALYWQYFENLDKITPHKTPLKLEKKLFIEVNTDKGPILKSINDKNILKPGDKIIVRIILTVDRNMEYVHMKDMRASGLEPVNVISTYKYQGGLWYYESTKDASTNFFIPWLNKGSYVFEYPLRANLKGDFSNGITTIQCMYAPEFSSHSEGIRIEIK